MRLLAPERDPVVLVEQVDALECVRVLRDERALVQQRREVLERVVARKVVDLAQELVLRDARERVLDAVQACQWGARVGAGARRRTGRRCLRLG